ncbi:MAG: Kdo2-lipid lauroyltransferase/acyltransferase [Verrucomicrobiota bacterium]
MASRRKHVRYRIEWFGLVTVAKFVPLLPRKICFYLAKFLGAWMSILDRPGRRVALSNLEAAFGDRYSPSQRAEIVRQSYQCFARTMLDLFWSPRLTTENFARYIDIENLERLKRDIGETGSCIFAVPHYGNFEWLSPATALLGYPTHILTQEFKNPLLDSIFDQLRANFGSRTVPREGAVVRLYKALRRRGCAGILVDLSLRPHMTAVPIDCFGLKASVPFAHAWLSERTGAPIIPLHCEPLPKGRWRVVFHEKLQTPQGATHQQVAQACWDRFEPIIRKNPAPWLWTYKLWRFLPANPNRPYPFYANFSPEFEALIRETEKTSPSAPASV